MEYLEIKGAARLKPTSYVFARRSVLERLEAIPFFDDGFIAIHIESNVLSIIGEGATSSVSRVRALMEELKVYLADQSSIEISSVRWETTIVLSHSIFPLESHFESSRPTVVLQ